MRALPRPPMGRADAGGRRAAGGVSPAAPRAPPGAPQAVRRSWHGPGLPHAGQLHIRVTRKY